MTLDHYELNEILIYHLVDESNVMMVTIIIMMDVPMIVLVCHCVQHEQIMHEMYL